jgi:hypothetical protein
VQNDEAQKALSLANVTNRVRALTREEVWLYLTLLRRLPADLVSAVEKDPEVLRTLSYRKLLAIAIAGQSSRRSHEHSCHRW